VGKGDRRTRRGKIYAGSFGKSRPKDPKAGAGWLLRAAHAGSAQSAFNVAVMYERGFMLERNPAQAVAWYRRAAGANLPIAKHHLALMLRDGKGTARDGKEAVELILGVTPHNITGTGALANTNIGRAWLLPPTLLAQWHFTDFGPFKPYIGLGLNYTIFFGQSAGYTQTNGLGVTNLTLNNTVGGALQVGFDYMFDKHWGVNFDVKKYLLRPTYNATVNNTIPVTGTAAIDPWIIGAGVTYRF